MNRILGAITAVLLWTGAALAQSQCPSIVYGAVLTAAQWQACFSAKNDVLGYSPVNKAGDVMTGKLVTAASTTIQAGLSLPAGAAPTSPINGDVWTTTAGMFARINGATVGPFSGTVGPITFTGQITTQGLTTTSPGWYAQITGDTNARVRVGLNATDVASIAFGPGNAVRDAFLERVAAGAFRLGSPDAAAPVAQTLGVQNVVAGTSNTAGANLTIDGSQGTGTGVGGSILFKVAPAGSTGSTQNALATALTIDSTLRVTHAGATTLSGALTYGGVALNNAVTGTGNMVLSSAAALAAPVITGGTHVALTSLGIRSTGSGAFDLTLANTENLTAGRTLTFSVSDASRLLALNGNVVFNGAASLPAIAQGDLWYGSASGVISALADVATGNALISGGIGAIPSWGKIGLTTHVSGILPIANGGTNCASASGTCLDNIAGFASTGFLTRTGAGTYAFQSATNGVTFGNLAQGSALSVLGVTGNSGANLASIVGVTDQVLRVNSAGTALGFGSIDLSKSGTVGSSQLALANLANISADFLVGNFTGGSAAPGSAAIGNCANALTYNTSTHAFGCNSTAGTGTVTQVVCGTGLSGGTITATGTCAVSLTTAFNVLGGDVALSNISNYFDGPSMTQGTSGTWFVSGTVTVSSSSADALWCKLWDGTTTIASAMTNITVASDFFAMSLSGYLASPAANLRISCRDPNTTNGKIIFNATGNSKDSSIWGFRIN